MQIHVAVGCPDVRVPERNVIMSAMYVESEVLRVSLRDRFRQWRRSLRSTTKGRIHRISVAYAATIASSTIALPYELKPGESIEMEVAPTDFTAPFPPLAFVTVRDGLARTSSSSCKADSLITSRESPSSVSR